MSNHVTVPSAPELSNAPVREFYVMRGPSGCGKSQFAANHFPPACIVSSDEVRFAATATPYQHASDEDRQTFEREVWDQVFRRVAELMEQGQPHICLDATNCKTRHLPQYQQLAENHGYRSFVIDMTDVPFAECLRRNAERKGQRRVPFQVIEHQFDDAIIFGLPDGMVVLTPEQAAKRLARKVNP